MKEKCTFHINADELSSDLWKLLTERYECTIERKQHSIDGIEQHIYIEIKKKAIRWCDF